MDMSMDISSVLWEMSIDSPWIVYKRTLWITLNQENFQKISKPFIYLRKWNPEHHWKHDIIVIKCLSIYWRKNTFFDEQLYFYLSIENNFLSREKFNKFSISSFPSQTTLMDESTSNFNFPIYRQTPSHKLLKISIIQFSFCSQFLHHSSHPRCTVWHSKRMLISRF